MILVRRRFPFHLCPSALPSSSSRFLLARPQHSPSKPPSVSDADLRWQISMAFRDTVKEWARVVPPEFISRPSSFQRLPHKKKHDDDDDDEVSGYSEDSEEKEEEEGYEEDADELDEHISADEDASEHNYDDVSDNDEVADIECEKCIRGSAENVGSEMQEDLDREKLDGIDDEYDNSHTYYITDSGKIKYKHLQILAPKDEIYQKLSEGGLISPKFKRPLPVLKLINKPEADIVGWFYYCSIELLQYFRICHNLNEVKAIVEYHIRWSAIRTLAKKYKCNEREIVRKYGRDLECEDKKGKKVRLMSKQEIKQVTRGVNKRVQITHRFRALRILAEME